MYVPEISASAVAGVIGLHPYKPKYEAIYSILRKDKSFKERIQTLEKQHKRVSIDTIRRQLSASSDVRHIVSRGLRDAATTEDVTGIVGDASKAIGIYANMVYHDVPDNVRKNIVQECASEIQKRRGLQNENDVLDEYQQQTSTQVTERNTVMRRKDCGDYKLCGRIDGYVKSLNRIIDSKERTKFRDAIPVYDEIQLRVYMELMDCPEAELIERFPNRKHRNTIFERDANMWKPIHDGLTDVAALMRDAATDDTKLLKIIESNTFTYKSCTSRNEDNEEASI
jgi:16S rRNA G966 N2-methylase RsmD